MKKNINGKAYNTETARKCGSYTQDSTIERLYIKKTGEFFVVLNAYDTEQIIPVSYAEAETWAKRHMTSEKYNEIFGKIADKSAISIKISRSAYQKAKRKAHESGTSVSKYLEELIENDK